MDSEVFVGLQGPVVCYDYVAKTLSYNCKDMTPAFLTDPLLLARPDTTRGTANREYLHKALDRWLDVLLPNCELLTTATEETKTEFLGRL